MSNLPEFTVWQPLTPPELGVLLAPYPGRWCIGGGWSLDLFAGTQSRPHDDIDVVVARSDLELLHPSLPGWLLYAADGNLTLWEADTPLPQRIDNIWCRRADRPWELQLMVSEFTDTEWVYRRDPRVRGPIQEMIVQASTELPIMAPEIQLLYKSSPSNRPKDEFDFTHTLPFLSDARRSWLAATLELVYSDHPWLANLHNAP